RRSVLLVPYATLLRARETYLGLRPRPLRELALTVEARRRGVAAAEVLAARVEGRLAYRGALVTAEVPAAATLLEALRGAPDGARSEEHTSELQSPDQL